MVAIKVAEFAYPRMEAPDLDEMEEFLTHFGLVRAERTPDALYMRGTDGHHHLHAVHKGGTRFIGFGYHAASEDDLKRIAKLPGASGIDPVRPRCPIPDFDGALPAQARVASCETRATPGPDTRAIRLKSDDTRLTRSSWGAVEELPHVIPP